MTKRYDLVIVGAGVLGAFHAYHAIKKGLTVLLLEKDKAPQSATTRNFGQVVPSGMNTKWQLYGRESIALYNEIQARFDITVRNNGSVYIASNEEEQQLLEELRVINAANDYTSVLLTKTQCLEKYPGLRSNYAKTGLFFPQEITVEPRTMIHRLLAYLVSMHHLEYKVYSQVLEVATIGDHVALRIASSETYKAAQAIICNGSECKTLFPELFTNDDLEISKLQMLQTVPQQRYALPGSVLTGLTIRRYEAFHECPSFAAIKAKEADDSPEKKWGVHILFKQALDGSIIIGDSHEYAGITNIDDLGYNLDEGINEFMIAEAKKIIDLPDYAIQSTWYGLYAQCKTSDVFQRTIDDRIHIVTGIGGKGMTGSAGFSRENIEKIVNTN